jgi:hypothetical protein
MIAYNFRPSRSHAPSGSAGIEAANRTKAPRRKDTRPLPRGANKRQIETGCDLFAAAIIVNIKPRTAHGVQHKHPDRRGEIGVSAPGVNRRDKARNRLAARNCDALKLVPE